MNPILGMHIGYVVNNLDPEGRQRLQVFVPHISATLYDGWNDNPQNTSLSSSNPLPSPLIKRLKQILPWAESASAPFGMGGTTYRDDASGQVKLPPQGTAYTPPEINYTSSHGEEPAPDGVTAGSSSTSGLDPNVKKYFTAVQAGEFSTSPGSSEWYSYLDKKFNTTAGGGLDGGALFGFNKEDIGLAGNGSALGGARVGNVYTSTDQQFLNNPGVAASKDPYLSTLSPSSNAYKDLVFERSTLAAQHLFEAGNSFYKTPINQLKSYDNSQMQNVLTNAQDPVNKVFVQQFDSVIGGVGYNAQKNSASNNGLAGFDKGASYALGGNVPISSPQIAQSGSSMRLSESLDPTTRPPQPSVAESHGVSSSPANGTYVWVFFHGGDAMRPVYFASVKEPTASVRTAPAFQETDSSTLTA